MISFPFLTFTFLGVLTIGALSVLRSTITITQTFEESELLRCPLLDWLCLFNLCSFLHASVFVLYCRFSIVEYWVRRGGVSNKGLKRKLPNLAKTTWEAQTNHQHHYLLFFIKWRVVVIIIFCSDCTTGEPYFAAMFWQSNTSQEIASGFKEIRECNGKFGCVLSFVAVWYQIFL